MPQLFSQSRLALIAVLVAGSLQSVPAQDVVSRGSAAWGGRHYGRMEFAGERDAGLYRNSGIYGGSVVYIQPPFSTFTYYQGPWPVWGYGPVMWGYSNPYLGPGAFPEYGPQVAALPTLLPPLAADAGPAPAGGDRLSELPAVRPGPARPGRAAPPVADQPDQENPAVQVRPSNVEQRRRSLRYLAQGDESFHKQEFLAAVGKYRQAAQAARDLPEPRLRLGMALATIAEYQQAVNNLKWGLKLDPEWPAHGLTLDEQFGEGHDLAKNSIIMNIGRWVEQDIRDPDRQFLFGVFLYFNGDYDSARRVFETAAAITNGADHLRPFLELQPVPRDEVAPPPDPGIPAPSARPATARGSGAHGGRSGRRVTNEPAQRASENDAPVPHPPEDDAGTRPESERR